MKKKQLIGIVVTGIVIIAVGVTGVLGNVVSGMFVNEESSMGFWESFASEAYSQEVVLPETEFVGVINVVGEIGPSATDVWSTSSGYNHTQSMDYVDQLMETENNRGILLYIDSPGGTVYESDELYLKLMEYKETTGRPIWAYFASEACSGGYYIAMAADKIYANRNCWTGSIGVVISLLNCEGLYEKLGIEEINITSGENKAMGSAGSELTEEQKQILQSLVDEAYNQFVGIVSEGRRMSKSDVKELADGRLYSALQAKENKLIDEIGSLEDSMNAFIEEAKFSPDIYFHEPASETSAFMTWLYGMAQNLKPKTDSQIATEIIEENGNGVLMYYAK